MPECIIDFQAFKDDDNQYILKELAIVSVETNKVLHCLVRPPYNFDMLRFNKKQEVC